MTTPDLPPPFHIIQNIEYYVEEQMRDYARAAIDEVASQGRPRAKSAEAEQDELLEALKHQRRALALLLERQCHGGTVTVSEADVRQGLKQIDAAIDAARKP